MEAPTWSVWWGFLLSDSHCTGGQHRTLVFAATHFDATLFVRHSIGQPPLGRSIACFQHVVGTYHATYTPLDDPLEVICDLTYKLHLLPSILMHILQATSTAGNLHPTLHIPLRHMPSSTVPSISLLTQRVQVSLQYIDRPKSRDTGTTVS